MNSPHPLPVSTPTLRRATEADAPIIARQRRQMFHDNNLRCVTSWEELERNSTVWLEPHLRDHSYVGWLAGIDGRIVGGAGVWFMEWPPHFLHAEPMRGYLLNFYVAPEARGRGLATEFVARCVAECRQRNVRVAVLHASAMGRPVYERLGWKLNNEMMFITAPQE